MPSLKDDLLMYLKKLRKRDANQEMRQNSDNDGFRIEGMNMAYAKIVRELEAILQAEKYR